MDDITDLCMSALCESLQPVHQRMYVVGNNIIWRGEIHYIEATIICKHYMSSINEFHYRIVYGTGNGACALWITEREIICHA